MPQIDFGKAFAPTKADNSGSTTESQPQSGVRAEAESPPSPARRTSWAAMLNRSDWTNILFVIVALSGGLFSAFYFFNGAELMRAAAAWPRELLYSRPFGSPDDSEYNGMIASSEQADPNDPTAAWDNRRPFGRHVGDIQLDSPLANGPNANSPANAIASAGGSGGPNATGVPGTIGNPGTPGVPGNLNPPGRLPAPSLPSTGPLLAGLPRSLPGGDGLAQALDKGAADLQRATRSMRNTRTVVVINKRIARASKRVEGLVRDSEHGVGNGINKAAGGGRLAGSSTMSSAHSAQSRAIAAAGNAGGAGRSALGGLGRSNAMAGLGRSNATSGVGRSNAIGGLGRGGASGGLGAVGSGFGRGGGFGGGAEGLGRAHGGLGHGGGGRR